MAKVTMTLNGFDQFKRAMAAAPDLMKVYSADAVAKSSFAVAQRARSLVRVATGRLKASIASTSTGLNGRVGISDPRAFYWRFVEFGTVRLPARPFFRPAAEAESENFIQNMRVAGQNLERDLSSGRNL